MGVDIGMTVCSMALEWTGSVHRYAMPTGAGYRTLYTRPDRLRLDTGTRVSTRYSLYTTVISILYRAVRTGRVSTVVVVLLVLRID